MAITITRDGYGVVEPNHLSAPRDGRVYGQLPAADTIKELQNGMFVKYNYAEGVCSFTGDGPWMLVFNEEKLYDERFQMHKHYHMVPGDFYDGKMYPRVLGIVTGDIFTTNMFAIGTTLSVGNKVAPGEDGVLALANDNTKGVVFQVVKEYTMPDGQPGVKLQCIQV